MFLSNPANLFIYRFKILVKIHGWHLLFFEKLKEFSGCLQPECVASSPQISFSFESICCSNDVTGNNDERDEQRCFGDNADGIQVARRR
ncbi:hypothetical protein HanRHA438_Chr12g0551171 [Helianthus annuus]|nr:hypothetical protein HanIR_Chr12g0581911 [Helianthus annuus]KAJ0866392.1 hypothetical protein HanRHA438_Chr12g0551171 [Helianthus annuus]